MTTSVSSSSNLSNTTGLISSAGLGSGLDVKSIVAAMVAAEGQPIRDLKSQASDMQTQLSAFGQVKSYLSTFRDAIGTLSRPATWNATTGSSSNAAAVSITTESGAANGNYNVAVTQLATSQTLSSRVFSATEAVGAGTLSIQNTAGGSPVNITIGATDTLAAVRDKINGSDGGLTAHIQTDSTGSKLVLQSTETGSKSNFKISATDADGNNGDAAGLSALSYDPSATTNPLTQQQAGQDALASINGVSVTSSSNTLANVLDGVTMTLGATTAAGAPANVTVALDTTSIKSNITAMVTAYNALQTYLANQTKYDAGSKTAGTLQGDSTTNGIRNQLRQLMSASSPASATFGRLSDIGFDLQKDGTINVNATKLASGLNNVGEMSKLFANSDASNKANNGLATQLRDATDSILGVDGMLTTRTNGIQGSITRNSKRQDDMQTRLDQYQSRVQAQYNALDTKMSELSSLSNYVTQQITQMNKSA